MRSKAIEIAASQKENLIIIDGAPGTGCPVIASVTGADYALIITEPTVSGIHDMKRILDVTRHFSVKSGVVVNKHDLNLDMTEGIKSLAKDFGVEFLGIIPYDKKVTEAQTKKLSLVEYINNSTTESIKNIWERAFQKIRR